MSDEQAEVKQKETDEAKKAEEDAKKAQEEAQKRLWMLTLILDPESGQFVIQPNHNIKKQWQLNTMLDQALKSTELTSTAKVVGEMVVNILKVEKVIKSKKNLSLR